MGQYLARRLLLFIPTLIGASLLVFVLVRLVPGDPALLILTGSSGDIPFTQQEYDNLRASMGLDKPMYLQYISWLGRFVTLDWGKSLYYNSLIVDELKPKMILTLELAIVSMAIATVSAVFMGVLAAVRQDTFVDRAIMVFSVTGLAVPTFVMGLLVLLFLVKVFQWFPPLGTVYVWDDPWTNLKTLAWPILVVAYFNNAAITRMTRAQMLEVLRQDYMRTARAKGLIESLVVYRHGLRNAVLPVVTLFGLQTGALVGGALVIETVFSLPGMGRFLIESIQRRDYPIVEIIILIIAFAFVTINLLVDLSYGLLDPRIRVR